MGYAYCPFCRKSFRFRASANGAPPWLRQVAQSLGRGETPVLSCYACWVEPEVGDLVAVIDPPYDHQEINAGAIGRVVEVQNYDHQLYLVEELTENGLPSWHATFARRQIKAASPEFQETAQIDLSIPRPGT